MQAELCAYFFFFCKQKTAYEITYGDWSSDVCSSDLARPTTAPTWRDVLSTTDARPARSLPTARSEERRGGKECRRLCRSRWSAYHEKKKVGVRLPGLRDAGAFAGRRAGGAGLLPPRLFDVAFLWPLFFFFKQKTAYEITYGDWSSDVCTSDLSTPPRLGPMYGIRTASMKRQVE